LAVHSQGGGVFQKRKKGTLAKKERSRGDLLFGGGKGDDAWEGKKKDKWPKRN